MEPPQKLLEGAITARSAELRDPVKLMFDRQRAVADDLLRAGARVAMQCGRRAGKSECFLLCAIACMQARPGCNVGYIALSRPSAKRILWPTLHALNDRLGLGLKTNEQELLAIAPNGSRLYFLGADTPREIAKIRGVGGGFVLVGLDEAAYFRPAHLEHLLQDVIEPALIDQHGSLAMFCTPGPALVGLFYHITTGTPYPDGRVVGGWKVHKWDMRDNPFIRDAEAQLEEIRARWGWAPDNPTYLREYLNQWVRDDNALVYRFDRARNGEIAMPDGYAPTSHRWGHMLGIDYGYVDSTAWVVWGFRCDATDDRRTWAVESFKWPKLPRQYTDGLSIDFDKGILPSDSAAITQRIVERYQPWRVRGDTGGLGKPYAEEGNRRWGLHIEAAEKRDKLAQIEVFNDGLLTGQTKFILSTNADYLDEMEVLAWDLEKVEVNVGGRILHEDRKRVDPRFEDHLCSAGQYSYSDCVAYWNKAQVTEPSDPIDESPWDRRDEAGWLEAQEASKPWWDR